MLIVLLYFILTFLLIDACTTIYISMEPNLPTLSKNIHNCSSQRLSQNNDKSVQRYPVYEMRDNSAPAVSAAQCSASECLSSSAHDTRKGCSIFCYSFSHLLFAYSATYNDQSVMLIFALLYILQVFFTVKSLLL